MTAVREIVPRAFDRHQLGMARDEAESRAHFIERTERIARAVNEQGGCAQLRKMRGARLLRFIRRMERVRQQEQRIRNRLVLGCQHAGLPAAVGVPAQKQANRMAVARGGLPNDLYRAPQSRAVLRTIAERRTVRARLAERQIAAQHHDAGRGECLGHGDQQRRVAVGSCAMGEHERVRQSSVGAVQEAAHNGLTGRLIDKAFHRTHTAYTVMIMELSFVHRFVPASDPNLKNTLLALHGTGGDESDLVPLAQNLVPGAAVLSPRGKVLENGVPRFFRRLREGVFDEQDVIFRAGELAEFVTAAAAAYHFDPAGVVAMGYSNGANIAAAVMLLHPGVIPRAVLFRPMVPIQPDAPPDLRGAAVFIGAGRLDPIVPQAQTEGLATLLRECGAQVSLHWSDAGHGLVAEELDVAKDWLSPKRARLK